jgi:hypothetical protein
VAPCPGDHIGTPTTPFNLAPSFTLRCGDDAVDKYHIWPPLVASKDDTDLEVSPTRALAFGRSLCCFAWGAHSYEIAINGIKDKSLGRLLGTLRHATYLCHTEGDTDTPAHHPIETFLKIVLSKLGVGTPNHACVFLRLRRLCFAVASRGAPDPSYNYRLSF